MLLNPPPHSSGVKPPKIQPDLIPNHIAIVMDGNGRWAKKKLLPRLVGHNNGLESVRKIIEYCIKYNVKSTGQQLEQIFPSKSSMVSNVSKTPTPPNTGIKNRVKFCMMLII